MGYWSAAVFAVAIVFSSDTASACMTFAGLEIEDVQYADVVVMGRISNYEVVLDKEVRIKRKEILARKTNIQPAMRKMLTEQSSFLSDYARFNILVDEVLRGEAPHTLTVTWDNSTFGEPEKVASGPYLIALKKAKSRLPPLRGPSATILPNPDPDSLTILQAPCSGPFIFATTSKEAAAVRELLKAQAK